jgi:hypothetical protein
MPTIFCSHKLAKFLGISHKLKPEPNSNWDWNAHLFLLDRRKCLVFVEKESLYTVAVFGIVKKDLKNLKSIFLTYFLEQLNWDKLLTNSVKDLIIRDLNTIELSTTDNDKSMIGYINDCVVRLKWHRVGDSDIAGAKYYLQNYFHDLPLGMRDFDNARNTMTKKLNRLLAKV